MLRSHIVCFVEGCAGTDKVASRQLNEILRLMMCLTFAIRGLFSTQVPALRQSVSGQADFTLQISGRLQLRAVTPTKISPLPEHQRSQVVSRCVTTMTHRTFYSGKKLIKFNSTDICRTNASTAMPDNNGEPLSTLQICTGQPR